MLHKFTILILLLINFNLFAIEERPYFCTSELETLPILAGGRIKPLYVHAKETIKYLSGKSNHNQLPAVINYCYLSFNGFGIKTNIDLKMKIEHLDSIKLLETKDIPYEELLKKTELIKNTLMSLKINDGYKKELTKILDKLMTYEKVKSGDDWKIYQAQTKSFVPIIEGLTEAKILELSKTNKDPFTFFLKESKESYILDNSDSFMLEYYYSKANLFSFAMFFTLLALTLIVLLKNPKFAVATLLLSLSIQLVAIIMRILISGRAPITNMYETVMFSGFGGMIVSTIIYFFFSKEKIYVISGLFYNFLCLMMMTFANNMLNSAIGPLVPVLRDNFWLSTHVTMIILSYGALALSWVIANINLIKSAFKNQVKKDFDYNVSLSYTCIKIGVVLLSGGIILGGVWADYSWGRFWGWDPKETWSLIALLIYMAILHGKTTSWISSYRFNFFVAGAFMSVMMAWFGVNYILASGLHSYGFSEGGAIFLGSFFLLQFLILLITHSKLSKKPSLD